MRAPHLALAACLATPLVPAQVSHVAGTGCGVQTTSVGGTPAIGQPISLANSFNCAFTIAFLGIGVQPASVPWPGCSVASCTIGLVPIDLTIGGISIWRTLWIPNNAALIGVCFYAQTGCISPSSACMQLDQAARICIQ